MTRGGKQPSPVRRSLRKIRNKKNTGFYFFASRHSWASAWYPATFTENTEGRLSSYNCVEQYLGYRKALLFGDLHSQRAILCASLPHVQRQLADEVVGVDEVIWSIRRKDLVYQANLLKFSQNPVLLALLLATAPRYIAEANPLDMVWSMGLSRHDPLARQREAWPGQNLLGEALRQARDALSLRLTPTPLPGTRAEARAQGQKRARVQAVQKKLIKS